MTSWDTNATNDTLITSSAPSGCSITPINLSTNNASRNIRKTEGGNDQNAHNDHRRKISKKEKKKRKKRKRKPNKKGMRVRFEYPPVTSFHERPKTEPDEIEKLYFTEHEMDTICDDRYSTNALDGVEVVAFSSLSLAKEEMKRRQQYACKEMSDSDNETW
eukprot:1288795-Ditylum_brightwellii.AAC.1